MANEERNASHNREVEINKLKHTVIVFISFLTGHIVEL